MTINAFSFHVFAMFYVPGIVNTLVGNNAKFSNSTTIKYIVLLLLTGLGTIVGSHSASNKHASPQRALAATANIPISEMNALYDLYNATTGEGWLWYDGTSDGIPWNFSDSNVNNPCVDQWQGIVCSFSSPFEYYHVVEIELFSFNLIGRLPGTLEALSQLQYLDLGSNELTGTIPFSLGNLSRLQYFDLDTNYLMGQIPETLCNLTYLTDLFLFYNELSGTIPKCMGSYQQLVYLHVGGNQLNGTIPVELSNLTQLHYMYLFENQFTGTIPPSFGTLLQLRKLELCENQLVGAIPETLGNLLQLQKLKLYVNQLTGTIPESLSNLTQLVSLFLFNNQLTGTIPSSLSNLRQITELELDSNRLVGTIPASFGNLLNLKYLRLYYNQLSGNIPETLGNLAHLLYLELYNNWLTNTIPDSLSRLTKLQKLELEFNLLNGTIPASLGKLTKLIKLELQYNYLVGTIPDALRDLSQMQNLHLGTNFLTGTIPDWLSGFTQLFDLNLGDNRLTGTIPASLSQLSGLLYLNLGTNLLTGTIPDELGTRLNLVDLHLGKNRLVGSIPNSFGNFVELQYLFLYSNYFTGSIPESFGNFTNLLGFNLDASHLSGTFPSAVASLELVQYYHFSNNHLTGTIPRFASTYLQQLQLSSNLLHGTVPSLAHLNSLQVVLLQDNHLTGNIDSVFDPTTQFYVESLVLNNNQLTGTLPTSIFQLKLQTFVGTSNCFEGPLPIDAICSNHDMVSFVIDGMSSAASCRNKLFVGPLSAYSLDYDIGGSLPTCLFQLPNITTLHLSGNGFTGSIPGDIVLGDSLKDVSLSHNALTGSIPEKIQLKHWGNIDLSYNRLSGTLSSDFASNGTVALEDNRLSGDIPEMFQTMKHVNVLDSNTFSCAYDEADLPQHDPNRERYHCGSNSFDVLYYVWVGATALTISVLSYYGWKYDIFWRIGGSDAILRDTKLYHTLSVMQRMSYTCAVFSIVVLLPLYAICGVLYSTQTYEYAYQISAVYVSGAVPFALMLCFWLLLLVIVAAVALCAPTMKSEVVSQSQSDGFNWQALMHVFTPYILIDIVVVAGMNAAYVYVAVYKSSSLLLFVQTLLSVFKVVWGRWALPYILTTLTQRKKYGKLQVVTQIVVNLLNNIAIPCLVVAVVSPNCFYNALVAAPEVTTTVDYRDCGSVDVTTGLCLEYVFMSVPTSFDPPFTYNYQCSSSLITYYSPAFVSMCIVSTFITPLAQYLCQWLYRRAVKDTMWYKLLDNSLPRILKPLSVTAHLDSTGKSIVGSAGLLTTLISAIGLVLTFGVMFPPLCIAFVACALSILYVYRVNVCRFIKNVDETQKDRVVSVILDECNSPECVHVLQDSVWVLITVSCWFYTLFLFDTLGDAVGFAGAYWVLIVMPLTPLMLFVLYTVLRIYVARSVYSGDKMNGRDKNVGIEMQEVNDCDTVVHNILVRDADLPDNNKGIKVV